MDKLKITELLKERNMTFATLAEKINVKRTTLLYNLSNSKIPLKYLIEIAKVLEVNVADLTDEEEVDITGYIKYSNKYFDLNVLNDFVEFTDLLVRDCGLESDLYYQTPKNELE